MSTKIAVIGAGHVGSHVARALAAGSVANEIVLIDRLSRKAEAQAMDIADAMSYPPSQVVVRAGTYDDCANTDITVVAIGKAREPGQTRLDLLGDSVRMVHELAGQLGSRCVNGLFICITNPCDIIADCLRQLLGMHRFKIFGTGTLQDTARLLRVLSGQTGVNMQLIEACVLGEHGDSSMIPFSALRIDGRAAAEYPGFRPDEALERTHNIGMDIIEGKGSTEFGIGQSAAFLCRAILTDAGITLPLSVHLEGEYNLNGINCGVPCVVGREGIRRIIELPLTGQERRELNRSAEVLRTHTLLASGILGNQ